MGISSKVTALGKPPQTSISTSNREIATKNATIREVDSPQTVRATKNAHKTISEEKNETTKE